MQTDWIYTLAMAAPQAGQQPNPKAQMMQMLAMMAFFILFMWLFLFRPQQKKAKEHKAMLSALKAGDKIVTNAGIVGVVISLKDKTVTVRSGDSKMEVTHASIADILERGSDPNESAKQA